MATLEERVTSLEDSLQHDFAEPVRQVMLKVDEQGRDLRDQGRDIRELGRDMREIKTRMATMDTRLNRVDERLDSIKLEMRQKFDQVIALLQQNK